MHQVEQSWQRIRALNVETIYPRHGTVRNIGMIWMSGIQAKRRCGINIKDFSPFHVKKS